MLDGHYRIVSDSVHIKVNSVHVPLFPFVMLAMLSAVALSMTKPVGAVSYGSTTWIGAKVKYSVIPPNPEYHAFEIFYMIMFLVNLIILL